jgi:hydrogenase maturation protein HypF
LRIRRHFVVRGIVQGVGFRPFVYRIAEENGLVGWVRNEPGGVQIEVEGDVVGIEAFARALRASPPSQARITSIGETTLEVRGFDGFTIEKSGGEADRTAFIPPDIATCSPCTLELFQRENRRFRYPFINCTDCGPRYTIIREIPYDRPFTTMDAFEMCPDCRREYEDPGDRRFHAQPNACPVCGPAVKLTDASGREEKTDDPIGTAFHHLRAGAIVAVKGLGGFHLACDASNEEAVRTLRERKHREEKPFALMAPDPGTARTFAIFSEAEEKRLLSPERPIVLLAKKPGGPIAENVAPRNKFWGVMFPYTPLHWLLAKTNIPALVMTSGNLTDEPIAYRSEEALLRLGGIADFFLLHDREIETRADDSITRVVGGREVVMRRSRGYVPRPVFLPLSGPPVLAVGPDLKNTVCLTRGDAAFLSHHIGDLENVEALASLRHAVAHLEKILDVRPSLVAHDLHPGYASTRFALSLEGLPRFGVQHHHAHIASVMAENGLTERVIGVAFDGTGYGTDGTVWGGEFLVADLASFRRAAHLDPVPLPGAEAAIREGWRMAVAHLAASFDDISADALALALPGVERDHLEVVLRMARSRINAPMTTSLGRLFDAVSALTGVALRSSFEGQAAMELEGIADPGEGKPYPFAFREEEGREIIETAPLVRAVAQEVREGTAPGAVSRDFHATLVAIVLGTCERIAEREGIDRVALSGGCFQNAVLLEGCLKALASAGFRVFTHACVPPNDGGIALGQAAVALAQGKGDG